MEWFERNDGWILPTEGTLGNKAEQLMANTTAIRSAGGKVPRSLVVPYEWLTQFETQVARNEALFSLIDQHFQGWSYIHLRPNPPDDEGRQPKLFRATGIYATLRDLAAPKIADVFWSYDSEGAQFDRKQRKIERKGLSLLVQEDAGSLEGKSHTTLSGHFTQTPDGFQISLSDPMPRANIAHSPLKRYAVKRDGTISEVSPVIQRAAAKVREIFLALPKTEFENWVVEYVSVYGAMYIVQTTPAAMNPTPQLV